MVREGAPIRELGARAGRPLEIRDFRFEIPDSRFQISDFRFETVALVTPQVTLPGYSPRLPSLVTLPSRYCGFVVGFMNPWRKGRNRPA